jgi:PIN domain nuclease of toxin-antitoxin system
MRLLLDTHIFLWFISGMALLLVLLGQPWQL